MLLGYARVTLKITQIKHTVPKTLLKLYFLSILRLTQYVGVFISIKQYCKFNKTKLTVINYRILQNQIVTP